MFDNDKTIEIKNYDEIRENLADMLVQFDKDANTDYQTDVYLYYDEKEKTASLDTFVNVGGNSWLNDDHKTIYTDKEHYDSGLKDYWETEEQIADALGMSVNNLKSLVIKDIARSFEITEEEVKKTEKIDINTIKDYVFADIKTSEKLYDAWHEQIDDMRSEYVEQAAAILEQNLIEPLDIEKTNEER